MPTAPKEVLQLVQKFELNLDSYRSLAYNEAQVRQEFINPLFEALDWDMANRAGNAEAYKDVIHEAAVKIGTATKAPDYAFRIGGTKKFFLEAKKPGVDIKNNSEPSYQLRRYAWSAGLPLSILTDFEEFAVYDCRIKPSPKDKASVGRIRYLTYQEYESRWGEIAEVFAKQAVLQGSFDRYAEGLKGKRGTTPVDDAFLKEIEDWRSELAHNLARRNSRLKVRDLNFAVQRTIDRIIFLRMCEDRGIEQYGQLKALLNGENVYARLKQMFYAADDKYNSGLFHFKPEQGRAEKPDELTDTLKIDNDVLKQIISRLYYPESPYEFSVLSSDILGSVYEQFLGKVIHLTKTHQARIEEKPEVKKAGGVYYTPKYIVDYIVKNTAGKLCENKTPKQIEKLCILDPACGSGSFLIGAYSYLLDYHRDWYVKNVVEKKYGGTTPSDPSGLIPLGKGDRNEIFQGSGGQWYLTTQKKKEILLNNIYGVDIDSQAVEVTKLNLLLKVLEGETKDTLESQMKLFHRRALPDLGNNIKCGNSLIGPDYYHGKQLSLLDEEEKYKINVFDWKTEFSEIMKQGGFDAVIGNPPYIPIESMTAEQRLYYQSHHPELERKYDSSIIFILEILKKLKHSGLLGFISSVTWQTGENYSKLRALLFSRGAVKCLVNLPYDVFKNAYVDTGIYILSGQRQNSYKIFRFNKKTRIKDLDDLPYISVPATIIRQPDFKIVLEPKAASILARITNQSYFIELGEITKSTQGLAGNMFDLQAKAKNRQFYPFLEEGQVHRYSLEIDKIAFTDMSDKSSLKSFYENVPKIFIRRVISRQDRLLATYFDDKMVTKKDINPFILTNTNLSPKYVLGIVNSRLISYLYVNTSSIATKDDFRQTTLAELRRLPIRTINFSDPAEKSGQDRMVQLVDQMLTLHKQLVATKTPDDKTRIERQIDATDRQIDQLVYELYGLTEEEVEVVEGAK